MPFIYLFYRCCTPTVSGIRRTVLGKKSIHHHRGTPLFSVCRRTLIVTEQKKAMVYTIFLGKQGKRVYTIGPERRVYTIEPHTRKKKKKGGLHGGGV